MLYASALEPLTCSELEPLLLRISAFENSTILFISCSLSEPTLDMRMLLAERGTGRRQRTEGEQWRNARYGSKRTFSCLHCVSNMCLYIAGKLTLTSKIVMQTSQPWATLKCFFSVLFLLLFKCEHTHSHPLTPDSQLQVV